MSTRTANGRPIPLEDRVHWEPRFWDKVARTGGCWEWCAYRTPRGYGTFTIPTSATSKVVRYSHRIAFTLCNGAPPKGLMVCHHCDNPACCRPSHLYAGTRLENMRDMVVRGRATKRFKSRTQCSRGHMYTPETTYAHDAPSTRRRHGVNTWRQCRACRREREQAEREKVHKPRSLKLYCKWGHPLFGANLRSKVVSPTRTDRMCRTCERGRWARHYARKASA